ncbi:MAG: DUF6210 family protein [Micrococcales bacterium]|nr:DUF6210 family protein [Micrococcales bacterium]
MSTAVVGQRYVCLDPDGMASDSWLYVVLHAQTGVIYQQQYGGSACLQGQVEGYLVPVHGPHGLAGLRSLFEGHFRGVGTCNYRWQDEELDALRESVQRICFWACDGQNEVPHALRPDEQRLDDADEAWIPVTTPDGPGILVWPNSD